MSTTSTRVRATAPPSRPATTSACSTTRRGTRKNASTSPNAARTVPNARPVRRRGEIPDAATRSAKNFYGNDGAAVTFVSFAGPTTPDVGDCLSKKKTFPPPLVRPRSMAGREEGYTCDMNRLNIIDVLFLDLLDEYSCGIECRNDAYCNFYTNYIPDGGKQRKCFLFQGCDAPEDCATCTT